MERAVAGSAPSGIDGEFGSRAGSGQVV